MVNPFTATGGALFRGGGGPSKGDSPRDSGEKDKPGGGDSFQEALKRGSAHAWKGRWKQAAEEYRFALKHSPKDVSARTYLAMALYKSGQLEDALELYQALRKDQPSNLSLLQRIAEVQEAMGDLDGAAASFQELAEIHTSRHELKDAFQSWQKAAAFRPNDLALWNSMIESAVLAGTVTETIPSYLELARRLALEGAFEEAIGAVGRAQILDPANPLVLPLLAAIRGALAYSWRATAQGEIPTPQDLARLIPEISHTAESPPWEDSGPPASVELEAETLPAPEAPSTDAEEPVEATVQQPEDPAQRPEIDAKVEEPVPVVSISVEEAGPAGSDETEVMESGETAAVAWLEQPEPVAEASADQTLQEEATAEPVELHSDLASQDELADEPVEAVSDLELQQEPADLPVDEAPDLELQREPWDRSDDPASYLAPTGESLEEADDSDPSMNHAEPDELPQELESPESLEDAQGAAIAEQLAEMAEAYERTGQTEQSVEAYGQALNLSPCLPRALLGMARLHLAAGDLESAEAQVRLSLKDPASDEASVKVPAAKLLLDILIGKVVAGDFQGAAEGLAWLRSTVPAELLPASEVESGAAALAGLLGQCGAEHLEELALLSPEARGEVVLALRKGEEFLEQGMIRSAIDEMYRLIAEHPSFLPAQSLLGRALAAQKRLEAARDRSQRLLQLYDMRGVPAQAMEVLRWRVAEGIGNGDDRSRLVQLLRDQNRATEAEALEVH